MVVLLCNRSFSNNPSVTVPLEFKYLHLNGNCWYIMFDVYNGVVFGHIDCTVHIHTVHTNRFHSHRIKLNIINCFVALCSSNGGGPRMYLYCLWLCCTDPDNIASGETVCSLINQYAVNVVMQHMIWLLCSCYMRMLPVMDVATGDGDSRLYCI